MCVYVCLICQMRQVLVQLCVRERTTERGHVFACSAVCGQYVSTSLCCWCCAVTLTVVSGSRVHIVNIPTSISVKWESGPECPSSDYVYHL